MLVLRYVGGGDGRGGRGKGGGCAQYILVSGAYTDCHAHTDDGCDGAVHRYRPLTPTDKFTTYTISIASMGGDKRNGLTDRLITPADSACSATH